MEMAKAKANLTSLRSVGPAALADLAKLGITKIEQLQHADADRLYQRLCRITEQRHDPCCRDVFAAAIAQAKNPKLPEEQRDWWYWSRLRKAAKKPTAR